MGNTQSGVLRLEEVEHIFLKVGRHHGCEPGSTLVTAGEHMRNLYLVVDDAMGLHLGERSRAGVCVIDVVQSVGDLSEVIVCTCVDCRVR